MSFTKQIRIQFFPTIDSTVKPLLNTGIKESGLYKSHVQYIYQNKKT